MEDSDKAVDTKKIMFRQKLVGEIRGKVAHLLEKNILIISGDVTSRERLRGFLLTLGFSEEKIETTNSHPAQLMTRIKKSPEAVDVIFCPLKALNQRVTSETGAHFLGIVKEILARQGLKRRIPFIFFEKTFEREEIISAFQAGASQFLVLPSDPISLGQKLIEVFEEWKDPAVDHEVKKLLSEGNKLQVQGLYEEAISHYNRAMEVGGENVELLTEKANTLLKMEDIDQAIFLFKKITELESNYPAAYQGLGMAYEQLGDYREAKNNYIKVIDLEPHNIQAYYSIGTLYQDEGNYDKAQNYFEKGIAINKNFTKVYFGLAKNYEALDRPEKALQVYKEAIEQNPTQTFLYVAAGDFCLKHNFNKDAEEIFSKAISQNETHIHLYNRMGIALRKQKKFDAAITNFAKALKINPKDPNLSYNLAKAYFIKGDELLAIEKLNKALELNPELKQKFEQDKSFSKLIAKYPDKLHL